MLQIAVCEDERTDREYLIGILEPILHRYTQEYQITNFSAGEELLAADIIFHLIFMDIVMEGEKSGIETGQEIYGRSQSAKIIYITNYGKYCMDAVNAAHAFSFLEKPVSADALEEQIISFLQGYWKKDACMMFRNVTHEENGIMMKKNSLSLPINSILYFEYVKSGKKIRIVMENAVYEYPDTMHSLEIRMSSYGFETSCRGILVSLRNVAKIKGYEVMLKNGVTVPLSQKRVAQFKKRLNEYIHDMDGNGEER